MANPFIHAVKTVREEREGLPPMIVVCTVWGGVDRPDGMGIGLPDTPNGWSLAARLERAILAGVVFPNPVIGTDKFGKTYAQTGYAVRPRVLNADLRSLGF